MSLDLFSFRLVLVRGILRNIGGKQKSMVSTYFSRRHQDICKFKIQSFRRDTWVEIPHRARKEKRLSLLVMRPDLLQYGLSERLLIGGRYSYWHVPTWSSTYITMLGSQSMWTRPTASYDIELYCPHSELDWIARRGRGPRSSFAASTAARVLAVYCVCERDCPEDWEHRLYHLSTCTWLSMQSKKTSCMFIAKYVCLLMI